MPLPSDYADGNCSVARALGIVGERWTLLIVRDAFYGVRRFSDFATQLGIPRAVLTARLKALVAEGILTRDEGSGVDYLLTDKGLALWPVLRTLMDWGDEFYSPAGPRRLLRHDLDDGLIDATGECATCRRRPDAAGIRVERGPGFDDRAQLDDPVSASLDAPRLLLTPVRPERGSEQ